MANTRISQLPEYTGSTTNGYMVFNNSGETTTYKYKLPIDLGNSSSPVQFLGAGSSSIKISGTTIPSTANSSVNSAFIGNTSSGFLGQASYSLIVGNNNVPQSLNYSGAYAYQFGQDNTIRGGGSFNLQVGNSNATNANGNSVQFGNANNAENGQYQYMLGSGNDVDRSYVLAIGLSNVIRNSYTYVYGRSNQSLRTSNEEYRFILGEANTIQGTSTHGSILNGSGNTINNLNNVVMLGTSGRTADVAYCTYVENLKIFNYSNLNYADDTAAAAGGVVLGQLYHNNGAVRVRIS